MTGRPFHALTIAQHDEAVALISRIEGVALLMSDAAETLQKPEGGAFMQGAEIIREAAEALGEIVRRPEQAEAST